VAGPDAAGRLEPDEGWAGALVCAEDDPEGAFALCRALRKRDLPLEPLLLLVPASRLADLELREDLFDDFCVTPFHPAELEARLKHLFWRTGRGTRPELVECGPLVLNLETYQAVIDSTPLDLTYIEYELLKFLATHPGRVFTRETLLPRGSASSLAAQPTKAKSTPPTTRTSGTMSSITTVRTIAPPTGVILIQ